MSEINNLKLCDLVDKIKNKKFNLKNYSWGDRDFFVLKIDML